MPFYNISNIWKRILFGTVMLCTVIWLVTTWLIDVKYESEKYLPLSANSTLIIHGSQVIEDVTQNIIQISKTGIFDKLVDDESDLQKESMGVNFRSNIILFKDKSIYGVILNLNNISSFRRFLTKKANKNLKFKILGATGIVVYDMDENMSPKKFDNYLNNIEAVNSIKFTNESNTDNYVSFYHRNGLEWNTELFGGIKGNLIFLNGKIATTNLSTLEKRIVPEGFHVTNSAPFSMAEELLPNNILFVRNINNFSINYLGLDLTNDTIPFLPLVSGYLTVNQEDTIINRALTNDYFRQFVSKTSDSTFEFNSTSKELKYETNTDFINITGDINSLLTLHGEGFSSAVIEMLPSFQFGQKVNDLVKNFNFQIENQGEVNFELQFKSDEHGIVQVSSLVSDLFE